MSHEEEPPTTYAHGYVPSSEGRGAPGQAVRKGGRATQALRASLFELTGGCGVCEYYNGMCQKHGIPVTKESPRCSSFVRRSLFLNEDDARKRQFQEYVNNMLGIRKEETVRRLVGR